jgi:uncharacterized protein YbjQ (UPF0145 family)
MAAESRSYLPMSTVSGGGVYSVNGRMCVIETLGMVFAHRTQGIAWYRDLLARMHDFFGGGVKSYDKPVQKELILPCLRELSDLAYDLYGEPHAVIGVTFKVTPIGAKGMSMMSVTAQGTAVRWVEIDRLPNPLQAPDPLEVSPVDHLVA